MAYHEQEFENMRELEDWLNDSDDEIDVVAAYDTSNGAKLKYYNKTEDKPKQHSIKEELKNYLLTRNSLGYNQYLGKNKSYTFQASDAERFTQKQAEVMAASMNKRSNTGGGWKPQRIERRY